MSSVPIVATNKSTGDVFEVSSDRDGYVNFVDLLPGDYEIAIDPQWLIERDMTSYYKGTGFSAPLEGGFVVLPDIELKYSKDMEAKTNRFNKVELTDENFAPNEFDGNDKLIHLPPKGSIRAAYSLENIDVARFNVIKKTISEEIKSEMRIRANKAFSNRRDTALGVISSSLRFNVDPQSSDLGSLVESIDKEQNANNYSTRPMEEGWVIQFGAQSSLKSAEELQKNIEFNSTQIVVKVVNGRNWFCVVSNVFKNKTDAETWKGQNFSSGYVQNTIKYLALERVVR
jgi:hypothetical protein